MKNYIRQKGFIQLPILITIIVGVLIIGGGGYFGVNKYHNYKTEKANKEKVAQDLQHQKDLEVESLKREVQILKEAPKKITLSCDDISLDKFAPGYHLEDLERFIDNANAEGVLKNLSKLDTKNLMDTYFASQWKTARPECKNYINNLVESRKIENQRNEQTKEILDQQKKLLDYQQCLISADQSTCQYLLY